VNSCVKSAVKLTRSPVSAVRGEKPLTPRLRPSMAVAGLSSWLEADGVAVEDGKASVSGRHPVQCDSRRAIRRTRLWGRLPRTGLSSVSVPKAARVLAALKRDGWVEKRRSGSHRVLVKGDQRRIWAYHDGVDLGRVALAKVAKDYGYELSELGQL